MTILKDSPYCLPQFVQQCLQVSMAKELAVKQLASQYLPQDLRSESKTWYKYYKEKASLVVLVN